MKPLCRGDIVQITDETHPWYGCLLVVTEPKHFGCQGFVAIPQSNDPDGPGPAQAFLRPRHAQITKVGRVALTLID